MNNAPNHVGPDPQRNGTSTARVLELVVCVWLALSAFAWPHSNVQRTDTWVVGVAGAAVALVSLYADRRFGYINALLAVCLLISTWALPGLHKATMFNNLIVALALFFLAKSASSGGRDRPLRHA